MDKWYGKVGYSVTNETAPGVWTDKVTERHYYGDILQNSSRWSPSSEGTNDNLLVNTRISIVADPFAYQNFHHIKYCEFMGVNWEITNIEPKRPRLILTLGGVYNG